VSPVKYEQGFYIPEDDILHNASRFNNALTYQLLAALNVVFVSRPSMQQVFTKVPKKNPQCLCVCFMLETPMGWCWAIRMAKSDR
jgi:hypothetical protein